MGTNSLCKLNILSVKLLHKTEVFTYIKVFVFRGEGNVYYGVGKLDVMMEGLRGVVAVALDAVTDLDAVVTNHVGGVVVEDQTMKIKLLRLLT